MFGSHIILLLIVDILFCIPDSHSRPHSSILQTLTKMKAQTSSHRILLSVPVTIVTSRYQKLNHIRRSLQILTKMKR